MGVRAIRLDDDDCVVSMNLAKEDEELLVITSKGYGKRTPISDYRIQSRGGKGMSTYDKKKFNKSGHLIGSVVISDDDELILINNEGIVIRIKVKGIRKTSRNTLGVKIMKANEDVNIVSVAKVVAEEEE